MQDPVISVVIPCFNGASFLEPCVRSILEQKVSSEIIIVNDGSTDESAQRAQELIKDVELPMALVSQKNQGPAAARNTGLRIARGRYVCFLDVDDRYAPGLFEMAARVMDSDASIVAVTCGVELVNSHRTLEPWQQKAVEFSLPGNFLIRTEVARQVGGFPVDEAFRGPAAGEDSAFRKHAFSLGKVARIEQPLFRYLVRPGSHFDYFLDRTTFEDGRIQFKYPSPQEQDGSFQLAQIRYANQVQDLAVNCTIDSLRWVVPTEVDFAQLSQKFEPVEGFLHPMEGFALYWLARHWPSEGQVVEIGSFKGRSTCWLASGCQKRGGGKVSAVDHFHGSPEHQAGGSHADADVVSHGNTLGAFNRNIQNMGLAEWVSVHAGSSIEISRTWQQPIRLLFIDGDHSYEATRDDFNAWARFLTRWGLAIFHDVRVWPGVTQFYNQVLKDTEHWREVLRLHSLGIVARIG